jgi:prepilin-type N-terminal cleavage/methylation domain-containing protein
MQAKRGFTLIELLVVLAIVAILSVVVILTLNPAELLKQARDSDRLSDLGTMKSVISVYLADVSSVYLGNSAKCYTSATAVAPNCGGIFGAGLSTDTVSSTRRQVDGSGWIPVNLTAIGSGAPIGNLPLDPINSATLYYAYAATTSNNGFKLSAILESSKYQILMPADGGSSPTAYEAGTTLTL